MRILGIDPGSRVTGYGIISMERGKACHIANGCIRTPHSDLAERLRSIFEGVSAVIEQYQPGEMAVEKVFVKRNVDSALKLGQARGAAIAAGAHRGLKLFEFTPAEVKKAIVGGGRAEKTQIQHMIRVLLKLEERAQADAADALALALCHGHMRETHLRIQTSKNVLAGLRVRRYGGRGLRR
ncbi:MAG: crossover junction endodeoxyribonuclease RuvC [Gammaproteobacteria bacterium]